MNREGLRRTPQRVGRMYKELLAGMTEDAEKYVYQMLHPSTPSTQTTALFSLERVIDSALGRLKPLIREKHIRTDISIDTDLPLLVVSEELLTEAIRHLCQNSIEAMSDNGELCVSAHSTSKSVLGDNQNDGQEGIVIDISDSGHGIPETIRDKVFEPFFSTKQFGTGVGLWLVHNLVKNYSGTVDIISHTKGTTVRICLPTTMSNAKRET